jgi:sec-independent protein translocase protein TatA
MFGRFGIWEIVLILVIILIVFGVGKLPQVGNAIGKGLRAFRKGQSGEDSEEDKAEEEKVVRARRKKTTRKKAVRS